MRSYEAARNLFGFLATSAWLVIVGGAVIAFLGGSSVATSGFGGPPSALQVGLAALPGVFFGLAGFFALAIVQMGRASVDTAEYAQQSLDVSRQHMEVSKQLLERANAQPVSYAAAEPHSQPATPETQPVAASFSDPPAATQTSAAAVPSDVATGTDQPAMAANATTVPRPALPSKPLEITYQGGLFAIGEETFKSKDAALKYREELLLLPDNQPS